MKNKFIVILVGLSAVLLLGVYIFAKRGGRVSESWLTSLATNGAVRVINEITRPNIIRYKNSIPRILGKPFLSSQSANGPIAEAMIIAKSSIPRTFFIK